MSSRDRPTALGPMPTGWRMTTIDERLVRAPIERVFMLAAAVEQWPDHLRHYRRVRLIERDPAGGGLVEMAASRPFGLLNWPTWWMSEMETYPLGRAHPPAIRFRHVRGITRGMEVEWTFVPAPGGTQVRIVHEWNGPGWPVIGGLAATRVIGPIFIHGIASRTLAGLAHAAER